MECLKTLVLCRNIEVSVNTEISNGDEQSNDGSPMAEKVIIGTSESGIVRILLLLPCFVA